MIGEALVQIREVGPEERRDRRVALDHVADEEEGLLFHRGPELRVELREHLGVGRRVLEAAQVQPLAGEVLVEGVGLRVGQHPVDLHPNLLLVLEEALIGQGEELVVRHARPEEVAQP